MYRKEQQQRLTEYLDFKQSEMEVVKVCAMMKTEMKEDQRGTGLLDGSLGLKLRDGVHMNEQSRLNDPEVKRVGDFHEWKIPAPTNTNH